MFSPLRPLRFDKKPKTATPQPPPLLPEEEEARKALEPAKLPPTLGFASDLKKLETAQKPEEAQAHREKLVTEAGIPAEKLRPVVNRRTGQQGIKVEDVGQILQEVSRKRGNLQQALKKVRPQHREAVTLAHVLSNMMDEATYQLSKGRESGAAWYDSDIAHLESGLAQMVGSDPAFKNLRGTFGKVDPKTGRVDPNNPRQVLFKALMTPLSYGQNPVKNTTVAAEVLAAAARVTPPGQSPFAHLPPRKPGTQAKDFKTGQPVPGKEEGWTRRAGIVAIQFKRLNELVKKLGEKGAADWLLREHTADEIREINPTASLPHGREHMYPGSYIFGPKGGAFFQNINRRQKELTKDLWFARTWNRILGSLMHKGEIVGGPRSDRERRLMDRAADIAAKALNLSISELQAVLWYYEQQLWQNAGAAVESLSYKDGINEVLQKRGLKPPRVKATRSEDEKRRQAAIAGATGRSVARHSKGRREAVLRFSRLRPLRFAAVGQAQLPPAPAAPPAQAPVAPAMPQAQNPVQAPMQQTQLPPIDEHRENLLAFSPNVDDLSFEDALARTRSGNQKAFKKIIDHIGEQIGVKPQTHDAVGDWSDGAENSLLQYFKEPLSADTLDYIGAWYGLLANQKSVLRFQPQHGGLDSVYEIEIPNSDLGQIRKSLDKAGIAFRTLIPTKKGTKIVLFDEHRELRDKVAAWAGTHNAVVRESIGQGRFIGGPTRTAARREYRKIITAYEAAAAASGGSVRAYKPPGKPSHLRSSKDRQAAIQQARAGRPIRFAYHPVDEAKVNADYPRDKTTEVGDILGDMHKALVGHFKALGVIYDDFKKNLKKKPRKRKFAADPRFKKHASPELVRHRLETYYRPVMDALKAIAGRHKFDRTIRGLVKNALRGDASAFFALRDRLKEVEDPASERLTFPGDIHPLWKAVTEGLLDVNAYVPKQGDARRMMVEEYRDKHGKYPSISELTPTSDAFQHGQTTPVDNREVFFRPDGGEISFSQPPGKMPAKQQAVQSRISKMRSALNPELRGKPDFEPPVKFSGVHAPAGGVVVRGLFYPGGKWIPSARLEKANYDQYQHVENQRMKKYRREDGSVSVEPALASEGAKQFAKGSYTPGVDPRVEKIRAALGRGGNPTPPSTPIKPATGRIGSGLRK